MIFSKLNVVISGTADSTLIFLPGMGGTTRYWQGRVTALEKRHRVLLVHPLGFGNSPKPMTHSVDKLYVRNIYIYIGVLLGLLQAMASVANSKLSKDKDSLRLNSTMAPFD
jgi:pimeloyl-ACP methyl ester carboxylesterase